MSRDSMPADPIVRAPHAVLVALRRLAAINDASEEGRGREGGCARKELACSLHRIQAEAAGQIETTE